MKIELQMSIFIQNIKSARLTIIRISATIPIQSHRPVLLIRRISIQRPITRQLLIIRPNAIPRCIRITKHPRMKHRISRRRNSRDQSRRRKGSLLDFCKVIVRVLVRREFSNRDKRIILVRPDLGDVEDVPLVCLCFLGSMTCNIIVQER